MKTLISLITICIALLLTGCAATPTPGSAEAIAVERKNKQQQAQQTASAAVAIIPAWYLTPPDDGQSIYASGVATSGDMQFAIDRAVLGAKSSLAAQINTQVSARITDLVRVVGLGQDAAITAEAERVSQNVVNEVNLGGFRREKAEVFPEGAGFRAYVLLKFPLAETTKIAREQVQKSPTLEAKLRASKKLDDFNEEIGK
jgi:hypothetical protein